MRYRVKQILTGMEKEAREKFQALSAWRMRIGYATWYRKAYSQRHQIGPQFIFTHSDLQVISNTYLELTGTLIHAQDWEYQSEAVNKSE